MEPFKKTPERTGESGQPSPQEMYFLLREQALTVRPETLGLVVEEDEPYGVVVDLGYQKAIVTLVAMGEGTTSIYFSSGGGVIGSGQHASVQEKALGLIQFAVRFTHLMIEANDFALPEVGRIRFYVLTGNGPVTVESSEVHLSNPASPLHPLFIAVHDLITEARLVSEAKGR